MNREIILEALRVHEDGIMQFTLGEVTVDEDGTIKCSDIYSSEWENHSEEIAVSIENILCSNIPLKPDMLVGIIVNEWFNYVGSDVEDLNYYGLLGVAIEIIDYIERYQCRDDNEQFEIIVKEIVMEEYIIETFKNHVGETMYKLIEVNEHGDKRELARLDYIQLQDLQFNIESKID